MNNKINYNSTLLLFFSILLGGNISFAQKYSINTKGTELYEISNKSFPGLVLSVNENNVTFGSKANINTLWRKTGLGDGYFFLDCISQPENKKRLLATSYLNTRLAKIGIEGRNDDVRWKLITTADNDWCLLKHKTTGKYLSKKGDQLVLIEQDDLGDKSKWKFNLKKIDLNAIESPIIMMGNDKTGFRDPALVYHEGTFYMYYSLVLTEEDEKIYWYVAYSKSNDLINWTDPEIITPKDQTKNYSSPGNVIRYNDEWVLCMQSYVMPGYTRKDPLRFGNKDSRVWITRSKDLENWSEPEMLEVLSLIHI